MRDFQSQPLQGARVRGFPGVTRVAWPTVFALAVGLAAALLAVGAGIARVGSGDSGPGGMPGPMPTLASSGAGNVTLQEVDGGLNYYARFPSGLPTDPSYFPIGAWFRRAQTQADFDAYRDFGMNLFAGIECPECTNEALIRQNGMRSLIQVDERVRFDGLGSEVAGWLLGDEVDMVQGPQACPGVLDQQAARAPADGRMRYSNYGKGVGGQFAGWTDQQAACFVNAQDLTSLDVYWFTDPNESSHRQFEHGFGYGDMVNRLRFLDGMDGKRTPQWMFVELGPAGTGSHRNIQPAEIRSAVWHSVIAGARGILYFDHNFGPGCGGSTILGQCYPANRAAARTANQGIKALAPVLNSPTVTSDHSVTGAPTRRLVKWNGSNFYVFLGTENGGTATFSMPCVGNATATRVGDETGQLAVSGGSFADSFADKNAVHIYRIDGGSTCGLPGDAGTDPMAPPPARSPTERRRARIGRVPRRVSLRSGRLVVPVVCVRSCTVRSRLTIRRARGSASAVSRRILLAAVRRRFAAGRHRLVLRLSARARRRVASARKPLRMRLRTVIVQHRGGGAERTQYLVVRRR